MQTAAASDQFSFLADDMVINGNDFSAGKAFPCNGGLFFMIFHMRREDTGTLAAITENGDTLAAAFIGKQVKMFRIFNSKAVGDIDS